MDSKTLLECSYDTMQTFTIVPKMGHPLFPFSIKRKYRLNMKNVVKISDK